MSPLYAEFRNEDGLRRAVAALSGRNLRLDVFTPYPVTDLEPLLGVRRSTIPRWVLTGGLVGAASAYLLQLWCSAVSYPINVGGRPLHSAPSFVPITFESGILAASLTAFFAVLVKGRLGRLYDPVFDIDGFERATMDRFWLAAWDDSPTRETLLSIDAELRGAGALRVVHGALSSEQPE